MLEAATRYYQKMLRMPEGAAALAYLRERGVSQKAIDQFRLGYAPDGRYAAKGWLAREGFADELLLEAGLLIQSEDGSRGSYDRFRGRLMFPITDRRGRVVGFGARILGPGEPKYLNSPETPVFHKGRLLYNLAGGVKAARDKGTLVVVEGYMDVIGLSEAGWANVVAPLGTALTEDQLLALWQVAPEPILLFDPDAAGERAAIRAAERALPLLKPGLGLKIALLRVDTKEDPDRVAARYAAQIVHRTLLEAAPLCPNSYSDWKTRDGCICRRRSVRQSRSACANGLSAIVDPGGARAFPASVPRPLLASAAPAEGAKSTPPIGLRLPCIETSPREPNPAAAERRPRSS